MEIWNSCFKKQPSGGRFPKAGDATTKKMTAERCEEVLDSRDNFGSEFYCVFWIMTPVCPSCHSKPVFLHRARALGILGHSNEIHSPH